MDWLRFKEFGLMLEFWATVLGVVALAVVFVAGVYVGVSAKKPDRVGRWLDRHGCYQCQELYHESLLGQVEELFDDGDDWPR